MNAPRNRLHQPGTPQFGPGPEGYGPPGFQQQPGGYGPHRPPRKKRAGPIVGVVIAVVVLVAGGILGTLYLDYTDEPGGGPGEQPIALCELSAELRSRAHVSSFRLVQAPTKAEKGMKQSQCAWEQTKGEDGRNPRGLRFHVYDFTTFSAKEDVNLKQAEGVYDEITSFATGSQAKEVDGLGDEAVIVIPSSRTDLTEVNLAVRKGTVVWNIYYFGRDKGFLSDSEFPVEDAEAVVRGTAEELTSK